jgi:hypothetical protein
MPLSSPRFAGVDRLERCLAGDFAARLVPGNDADEVSMVQQALIDLGESIPDGSTGFYGQQTTAAVTSYKTRHNLVNDAGQIDGIVGPKTMAKLDEEAVALDSPARPCPLEADGPIVDLGGADERLVNFVLAASASPRASASTPPARPASSMTASPFPTTCWSCSPRHAPT